MPSAIVKSLVVAVVGLILAVLLGSQLGKGSWFVPTVIAGGTTLIGVYVLFFRAVRLEALVLGALIVGYLVGNRGFAQLSLTQGTPLYVGELGMLTCLGVLGLRFALNRESLIPRTGLSWAILAFLVLGGIRFYFDLVLGVSGAQSGLIIRDSAVVYYALFFFIAYRIGTQPPARQVLDRCVVFGCIALLPVVVIQFFIAPDFFNHFTFRGYPLIVQKGDLTTTYLAFASFYFFLRPSRGPRQVFFRIMALLFFAGMLALMARAALLGFLLGALLLLIARRPQFVLYQAAVGVFVLIVIGLLQVAQLNERGGFLSRLTDRVESIADVSGTHSYRSSVGDSSASNNQFRLVWWRTVIDETMRTNPWFGLGFGADLTTRFLRAYFPTGGEETASARSPHSIWLTIFGRMGAIGLLFFSIIVFFILRGAKRAARLVASGRQPVETLIHWCAVLIILASASFGVVLEGPMAGILFWTFLGLASSQLQEQEQADQARRREAKKEIPPSPVRGRRFANV
jgi:hypothetical protein